MSEIPEIESKHTPPAAECAHCGHMLPHGLGEKTCVVCGAVCRVTHQPTVDALASETLPCPHCNTVVEAGSSDRPLDVACSACSGVFRITEKPYKVEIECPSCDRKLRIRPKPGTKQLNCPACDAAFNVTF
ncbi:MAG: hypothetical protein CMA78_04225 [Euryarchaeota archaeon]|nr:hypothetical protein [Euryarchaeota archaeon]|tara:strand:- start:37394 stop:37786 length:393 start_codon:yes stop_codon:yes gene_type:complete